ncbi:hypothetical protein CSKR_112174 [Clonorchis sinensis]|uniref:Uncharacterized protein n=1 Tax=Clonorchis sinensis TaxID=79923 RepID=A0A3R7DJY4_CLOSI|nr:hypothetical protein CSKR_112174 [Clonorchis sinensis]
MRCPPSGLDQSEGCRENNTRLGRRSATSSRQLPVDARLRHTTPTKASCLSSVDSQEGFGTHRTSDWAKRQDKSQRTQEPVYARTDLFTHNVQSTHCLRKSSTTDPLIAVGNPAYEQGPPVDLLASMYEH